MAGGAAGRKFIEALSVFSHLANVGDAEIAGDPSGHDDALPHGRRGARRRRHRPGTIRLSIGLEDPDDLIDDLGRALGASQKG